MAKFTLVRTREGFLLLTTQPVNDDVAFNIRRAFDLWKAELGAGLLIVPEGELVDVDLPIELGGSQDLADWMQRRAQGG